MKSRRFYISILLLLGIFVLWGCPKKAEVARAPEAQPEVRQEAPAAEAPSKAAEDAEAARRAAEEKAAQERAAAASEAASRVSSSSAALRLQGARAARSEYSPL